MCSQLFKMFTIGLGDLSIMPGSRVPRGNISKSKMQKNVDILVSNRRLWHTIAAEEWQNLMLDRIHIP